MEVDTPAVQTTSQDSSASVATHSATHGARASQTRPKLTGPCSHLDPETKQCTTTQQDVRNIVAGVLESWGMSEEDWGQSLRTDYWVDPLPPPVWSVPRPTGRHLSTI